MDNLEESRISRLTFEQQCEALSKDPRFLKLVEDIKALSPDRQAALDKELNREVTNEY